jgi:NADPH-dependent curcumin reductase CurA
VASRNPSLAVGTWVVGNLGWQDYALVSTEGLFGITQVPPGIEPRFMLGLFGSSGLTAYFGVIDIAKPVAGETFLVSGAAGAVGSLAGQIAHILGARVIGIAGGERKCRWLLEEAGFDACIDYRSEVVASRLRELAPDGVNVFFDNVGGPILEAALDNLALRARVVVCGGVSSGYTDELPSTGPRNYMQLGFRRARMEGFIFFDYLERFPEAFGKLAEWHGSGKLTYREFIVDGLEQAPATLQGLFDGANLGKQVVRVSDPATFTRY